MNELKSILTRILNVFRAEPKIERAKEDSLKREVDQHAERHEAAIRKAAAARKHLWNEVSHAESVAAGGSKK